MEQAASAACEIGLTYVVEVVKRHVGYLCHYKDNVNELQKYVTDLKNKRECVQHQVSEDKRNAYEIEADVQHWLEEMGAKITEYDNFLVDGGHGKTGCSIAFFPNNLQLRYRLGRKAKKMAEKTDKLLNKKFDRVSHRPGPSMDAALSKTGYESFASQKKTMESIMKALEDSTVRKIGVYGAGGVGKTTLVNEVAKKARENMSFDSVVMANITRNPDIKKIQGQIAEMLGMRLEEESEMVRAGRIRKRLMEEKENTFIILDDLWDGLDLNALGIPCDDHNDDDNNDGSQRKGKFSSNYKWCKILLTSRRKEVLCNQMDVEENSTFPLGILEEKEPETLLKKVAGIHGESSHLEKIATDIAKMCEGLPIAIVSIGKALKNKSRFVWEDACRQLKGKNFAGWKESIEFSTKLSYDHLKNEELRSIFLLCARMGNDPLIMDLVQLCIGLGMLEGVYTIREARDRVHVLIEELQDSSLLVKSYSNDRFNMHDIVRDVALSISSKEKHVFTMKNGQLYEWPHKDKLERYTVISLHFCDVIDELPESRYYPRLEVFHFDSKDPFLKIPDNFFEGMKELKVLILTGVHLSRLPPSIKCLTNLRMLCLEKCTLKENLSIIGELKKLRILTLSGSSIETLPIELGQLGKLQLLDLSNCLKLRVIPSNIISRLNSLEELYMRDNLIMWEVEQRNQNDNANLSELRHLNQLTTLEIHIPSVTHLPRNLFFDKLDSYKIVIGEFNMLSVGDFEILDKYESLKVLALELKDSSDIHSEKGIKLLFKRVENLMLGELNRVHDVFYELNIEGFPNLKHLSIVNNFGIKYIINSMDRLHPFEAFPKLESMSLSNLVNLEKICNNQLTYVSFRRLKIIKIKKCDQLKNVFSFFMVRLLTVLETIEVIDCHSLKEIVSIERQASTTNDVKYDDKMEFSQLRFLTLQYLPAFTCFLANDKMTSIPQSHKDQVPSKELAESITEAEQGANTCSSLFNEKVTIPNLECLELSSIKIQKIWSDQSLPSNGFQNLLTLNVTNCGNLNYLLSSSMAGMLVNLQSLFVSGCKMMSSIFSTEDARIDVFPKLKKMEITCMKELNSIWPPHIGLGSYQSLDILIIKECDKLVTVFPAYTGERFQSLQTLDVVNCKKMENIFELGDAPQIHDRKEINLRNVYLEALPKLVHVWKKGTQTQGIINFNNLRDVFVDRCHILENLFPLSFANGLQNLKSLRVQVCKGMKEIIAGDEGSNENNITFKLPQLTHVSLIHLFELRSLCRGTHTFECPSLKEFQLLRCEKLEPLTTETSEVKPMFSVIEKVISNLEYMAMNLKEATWLQHNISNIHLMHKLKSLLLGGLDNTKVLFWFLHRIPNLEKLCLINCRFEEVWVHGSLPNGENIGTVVQLKELKFRYSVYLREIGFQHEPLLQRVERLVIKDCSDLINLAPSSVSFSHLSYLEVSNCHGLRNLMASSTAKSLVQLSTMKVIQCEMMMVIVEGNINEEEKAEVIEFRQLKALELVSLENLTSFCRSENCDLKFPLLETLVVSECPRMKIIPSGIKSTPKLGQVYGADGEEEDRSYWESDSNATRQEPFMDQVLVKAACDIQHLKFGDHPDIEEIWLGVVPIPTGSNCFNNLKSLIVVKCESLSKVIPFYLLRLLSNLEEMEVSNCKSVKTIFDVKGIGADRQRINMEPASLLYLPLKKLTLEQLPNLEHIWNMNPDEILSLQDLQEMYVYSCQSLKSLFQTSVASHLVKLDVKDCDGLVEIVAEGEAAFKGAIKQFVFRCLTSLTLWGLPELKYFYPGKHHLEWPMLKELDVYHCDKLKLFTIEHQGSGDAHLEDQLDISIDRQAIISVKKVFPYLEQLSLRKEDIMTTWQGEFQVIPNTEQLTLTKQGQFRADTAILLENLQFLKLQCFHNDDQLNVFSCEFLQKLPRIEKVGVVCSSFNEIFSSQRPKADCTKVLSKLKGLHLNALSVLNSIGLEHSWVEPLLKTLETFEVWSCSCLKFLVQSTVSFSNLTDLDVSRCHGLVYLFTSSTAKSLGQLKQMSICECESIQEIVAKEGDHESDKDEIIFGQLNTLYLHSLPSLVAFYMGSSNLKFPSMDQVTLVKCPQMKYFCQCDVSVPNLLQFLTLHDENIKWEGFGNTITTRQKTFEKAA